jgi:hypothetical protein
VLDDHPGSLIVLEEALRRRYLQDYLIISETSAAAALGRLAELQASRRPVALVMVTMPIALAGDAEFLAQARGIQPTAKRVLVVPRGGPACRRACPILFSGGRPEYRTAGAVSRS